MISENGSIQSTFEPDEVLLRVNEGIELRQHGEHVAAGRLFLKLWQQIGGLGGDPFHRCAIAHSMADVCENVEEELAWDLRALDAADSLTDARAARGGVNGPVTAFYPSLHLNLAECYRKLGDAERALDHLVRGRNSLRELPEGEYSVMIGEAFDRIGKTLRLA